MLREGWATLLLMRRLTKAQISLQQTLNQILEVQRLFLKLELVKANLTLSSLEEAEEIQREGEDGAGEGEGEGEGEVISQTDEELALLERLEQQYEKSFGHPPPPELDLMEAYKESEKDKGRERE